MDDAATLVVEKIFFVVCSNYILLLFTCEIPSKDRSLQWVSQRIQLFIHPIPFIIQGNQKSTVPIKMLILPTVLYS